MRITVRKYRDTGRRSPLAPTLYQVMAGQEEMAVIQRSSGHGPTFWYANYKGEYVNTCNAPTTFEDAKRDAVAWVKKHLEAE